MKHSICAGGVVINNSKQVIVVNQQHNSWSLPKGHIENDETLLEAAKREIYEETGVKTLLYVKTLGSYDRTALDSYGNEIHDETKTIHLFLFETDEESLNSNDKENPLAIWVNLKDVPELLTHPRDKDFFNSKILELQNKK